MSRDQRIVVFVVLLVLLAVVLTIGLDRSTVIEAEP